MNRADRMYKLLQDRRPHSRRELHEAGGFYLTNNAASELRTRGFNVAQHVRVIDGRRVWYYQLVDLPTADADADASPSASTTSVAGSSDGMGLPPPASSLMAVRTPPLSPSAEDEQQLALELPGRSLQRDRAA